MIDKNAASKVLMVDLKEHGITDYGEIKYKRAITISIKADMHRQNLL